MQTPSTPPMEAPPRRKRRWKWLAGITLFLLGVLVGYYFLTGWQTDRELEALYAEMDADDPNWRWADLIAELEPPPDDQNAAVQILKVARLLKAKPFNPRGRWAKGVNDKELAVHNARVSAENLKALQVAFAGLDPTCLAEARKLKDLPRGRFPIEPVVNPFEIKLDWIQQTREVVHLLQCDAMARGQTEPSLQGSAESCLALVHAAHAINDHPFLISQLVRNAGQGISVAAIERLLGQGKVREAELVQLQTALETEVEANTLYFGMRGERAGTHRFFEGVRAGEISVARTMQQAGPGGAQERLLDLFSGIILRGEPEHLRLMNEYVAASQLPEVERVDALARAEAKIRQTRNFSIRMLMPAAAKVAEAARRTQANLRCAVAALAAERYCLRHGKWPATLKELRAETLLLELPMDPYDGKPLRWRITPTGAVVYSVGLDKADDGGKLDRANPLAKGTDLGFQLWNPAHRGIAPPVELERP
ncbi:MAG: hypothetical protein HYX68_00420 [Planctomycetes bacterium]|nr:hypothetical protein [Planctomycetota bacterium]